VFPFAGPQGVAPRRSATPSVKTVYRSRSWIQRNKWHGSDNRASLGTGWKFNHVTSAYVSPETLSVKMRLRVSHEPRGTENVTDQTLFALEAGEEVFGRSFETKRSSLGPCTRIDRTMGLCKDHLKRHTHPCPRRLPARKTNTIPGSSSQVVSCIPSSKGSSCLRSAGTMRTTATSTPFP